MENLNRWVGSGNLTRDPEYKEPREGISICNLRLAVNSRVKREGEWTDKANYFDVSVFGATARACRDYLSKGSGVVIDGRLDWREWQDKEGNKRQGVSIIADSVQFVDRRERDGGGGSDPSDTFAPANVGTGPAGADDIPFLWEGPLTRDERRSHASRW